MRQRPCIAFPKPPAELNHHDLARFMVRYMLSSGNAEIPVMFFDKDELSVVMVKGYTGGLKLEDERALKEIQADDDTVTGAIATLTVMAMHRPTGCILEFENKNALCVVGSGSSFYMIDLSNGVFYNTNGPEYDIQTYVDEYGSDHFKLHYFIIKEDTEEEEKKEKQPAPKKKRKAPATNKKPEQT